jgi:hypothetical protein
MLTCPYCRQSAITLWRKLRLAPEISVACSSCGKKIGVPWGAVAAAAPIALGIVGAIRFTMPWSVLSAIGGVLAYVALQRYVVPMVTRNKIP